MEQYKRALPPEILIPELLALLDEAESVPLVISGNSMTPFLVSGRDTVFLSKVTGPLKKGDMVLYRRSSGQYVLHRICKAEGKSFCLVGDAQTAVETGIRGDQVLAKVTAVRRKGRLLQAGSFWWDFFEKAWIRMIPLRPALVGAYGVLTGKRRRGA